MLSPRDAERVIIGFVPWAYARLCPAVSAAGSTPHGQRALPMIGLKAMQQSLETIAIATNGQGLYEFTRQVRAFVSAADVAIGLLTVFVRHTSCSLLIQENADRDVQTDLLQFFGRTVPEGMNWLVHTAEGADDMPAHIKAALTQTSIGIPVHEGQTMLGTWQGIYLFEHRRRPHQRQFVLHILGEMS